MNADVEKKIEELSQRMDEALEEKNMLDYNLAYEQLLKMGLLIEDEEGKE